MFRFERNFTRFHIGIALDHKVFLAHQAGIFMQHRCKFECVEGLSPEISASLASLEESLHVRWYIGIFLGHKVVQNLCKFSFVWTLRFRFPCVSWSAIARAFLLALSWATRLFLAIKQHSCATSWHARIGVYARDSALLVSLGAPLHVASFSFLSWTKWSFLAIRPAYLCRLVESLSMVSVP